MSPQVPLLRKLLFGLTTPAPGVATSRDGCCGLLIGLIGSLSLLAATPARAIGFTGTFDPSTWLVVNTNPAQTLNATGTGTGIDGTYNCHSGVNAVACLEAITSDSVDVVGSVAGPTGGGDPSTTRTTNLVLTNSTGSNYYISVDWTLGSATPAGANQSRTAAYKVGSNAAVTFVTWTAGGSLSGSLANIRVAPSESIQFIVTTSNNSGSEPVLSMSSFSAEVPAPLPAAGAASAFGFSRRLRRRTKAAAAGRVPVKRTPPRHPASYLNLAPTALHSLPVSFSYGSSATLRLLPQAGTPAAAQPTLQHNTLSSSQQRAA